MLCKYLLTRESLGVPTSRFLASNHASVARVDLSFMLKDFKNFTSDESSTVDNDGMYVPPLACAFAKMQQHQHIVGVVDEDGFLVLYNTLKTGNGSVIKTWQAHTNAVFDLEWLQQEDKILTGSGDQTIALHDVLTSSKLDTFKGHASSIKSISSHTSNDAVFVSGSRDGHIMLWDRRVSRRDGSVPPANTIYNAHMLQPQQQMQGKLRKKRISSALRDAQQSVTSVLFQNENFIISAGAVDGCLKVWDIRKTYKVKPAGATPLHVFSYSGSNLRRHGYTSLVLDSRRMRLFASCTDDVIYEYNMASYDSNPVQSWRGHKNSTFYVKTALSPDDQFLLSGSSDERAYIWQINKPSSSPIVLESHSAEVTSVAWCPNDITKLVTLSDDTKIKLWRVYCRELRDDLLPERCGQARKLSKERATSTDVKGDTTAESCPTLSATPKPILHKASSAPASAQSCMRTWLQTRVCSPLEAVQKQNQLKSSDKKSESNAETSKDLSTGTITLKSFRTHDKIEPQPNTTSEVSPGHSSKKEATPKGCSNCGQDSGSSLGSFHPYSSTSTSDTVSSSCDHSGSTSSESEFSSPVCVSRSLSKTSALVSQPQRSETQDLPSNHEVENLSPQKLKRKLNSDSPVNSPKRPCLTKIESNHQAQDGCSVKKNLFSVDINTALDSMKNANTNTDESITSHTEEAKGSSCLEATYSKLSKDKNEDIDSPTMNLPNLVIDNVNNKATPGRVKSEFSPGRDWLTLLRIEKQKKSIESKQASVTSPKVTKGMKKIQSYFKPKDTYK